MEKWNDI